MSGLQRIFVDFNNRIKRADDSEYYRVSLSELDGLAVGSAVMATDFEDIELLVKVSALLHVERAGIVQVVRNPALPAVSIPNSSDGVPVRANHVQEFGKELLGT